MKLPTFSVLGAISHAARSSAVAAFVLVGILVSSVIPMHTAFAAPLKGFEALQVSSSGSGKFVMKPGEVKNFTIQLKNIGVKAWANSGPGYVSVYTYGPKYRSSTFKAAGWKTSIQPAVMKEQSVRYGEVGTISFDLKAPQTEGEYTETFNVGAEDIAWIPGGLFTVNISVKQPTKEPAPVPAPAPTPTPTTPAPVETAASGLSALVLIRSSKAVTVEKGGDVVEYTVGVKNTGSVAWKKTDLRVPDYQFAAVTQNARETRHVSWVSPSVLVADTSKEITPGSLEYFTFKFRAPRAAGTHTVRYAMAANDTVIPDFYVDIPVTVTSGSAEVINDPIVEQPNQPTPGAPVTYELSEPMLRVGILIVDDETDNQVVITSDSSWNVQDENGALLAELKAGEQVTAFYKNNRYWFNRGKGLEQSTYALRFVPDEKNAIMKITNWDRRNRGSDRPYNRYRNVLELHYNSKKERTWLINELPMEFYLKGLGETSNVSHLEYQKALVTAARTYATYHWERGTKRAAEFFHVTGYADDQVYRGFDQETNSPRIVASVEATRGVTATYEGRTAITPYFSRSAGRTLDWSEVWGGTVAWILGKPAPCDKKKGYKLWGHGVGMSATEALCMANEGQTWDQILTYFYTGISLTRRWE